MNTNHSNYITQLQQYNSLLDKKYGRIGLHYQSKAQRLAVKLNEWKHVNDKKEFRISYEDSYKSLLG